MSGVPVVTSVLAAALRDRYMLERELGRGGMGIVYLAQDLRHERRVALKVLPPELASAVSLERFLREIRVAARLVHPHIVPVLDSGEVNGLPYYTMPYVEGESLRAWLERENQLPLEVSLQIASQVAKALSYAHGEGVVHRDIKPGNILIQAGHAVVSDFGLARALTAAGNDSLTGPGLAIGTPAYMSPEQARGREIDSRADIYSLGCVLYEMLVGSPPFTGPSAEAILAQHVVDAVPSLRTTRPTVPEEIDRVVLRALEKAPANRLATAEEFAQALTTHPATSSARTLRFLRRLRARNWKGAVVVFLTIFVLAVGIGGRKLGDPLNKVLATSNLPNRAGEVPLDPRHIAVLYFEPRGGQDSLVYLADGITEELIHELSGVRALRVISRNGVSPYHGKKVPPDSIARALKVGTLVQGTVDHAADRLRLSVSLIDGPSGAEIGSTTLERPSQQIFALQEDLAKEVSIFLRRRLGQEVELRENQARAGRRNPRSWHLLQHAEELSKDVAPLLEAGDTSGAARRLQRADSLLALTERVEPWWTKPSVARGWLAYRRLDLVGNFDKGYYREWTAKGMIHTQRALRIEPDDPEALELRGTLRYSRWLLNLALDSAESATLLASAEADLQAAGEANPPAAFALTLLSHLLLGQSRVAEAKLVALRAYEADPYLATAKLTIQRLFQSSLDPGDRKEAKRWCEEGQRRFPEYYRFTECQMWLYALKDQPPDVERVWRLYRQYLEVVPRNARLFHEHYGMMIVAITLARAGLADSAKATAARARADTLLDTTRDLALLEATMWTLLGNRDEAFHHLGIFLNANPHFRASYARENTWWFEDLRRDPRYHSLVQSPSPVD